MGDTGTCDLGYIYLQCLSGDPESSYCVVVCHISLKYSASASLVLLFAKEKLQYLISQTNEANKSNKGTSPIFSLGEYVL